MRVENGLQKHISSLTTFVSSDPKEWFELFEICCRANEWSDDTKALNIPKFLVGGPYSVDGIKRGQTEKLRGNEKQHS